MKKKSILMALLFCFNLLIYGQLEVLIGRCQPVGGFAAKEGQDQAGFAKQGMSFQFSGGAEEGRLAMTYSMFVTTNKFDVKEYRSYLNTNNLGSKYMRFDVGKYFGFGFTFGPEYLLEVGDDFIIPFKAHLGFQLMMPPLKFRGYYNDPYIGTTYDDMGGNWVYEVLGLNYRLGSGFGYKLDDDVTLMARVDYNNRFAGGQMTYGTNSLSATYPKKFKHVDIGIGLFINL